MSKVAVVIETDNGTIKPANFGVVTAALGSGDNEVVALITDDGAQAAADALGTYGVQKVIQLTADGHDLTTRPDLEAQAVAAATKEYGFHAVIGLASILGRDLFARIASLLDLPLATDCVGIDLEAKTVQKSHFSGKTVATLQLNGQVMLATIRPNAIEPEASSASPTVESFTAVVNDNGGMTIIEEVKGDADTVDLTEANVIITGGRPMASDENYAILRDCASLLGAAVGASRAAVDAGYAPHSIQVGQTGKTVSPKLYIACGLSGSVQHFAGMKTSKVIVAINTDKDAPIFEKCDYGIIGDLFEVVPALTKVLQES
jgi:electron transfer flavoprotein alpha subunit